MVITYTIYFDDGVTNNITDVCYSDEEYTAIKLLYPNSTFTSAKRFKH